MSFNWSIVDLSCDSNWDLALRSSLIKVLNSKLSLSKASWAIWSWSRRVRWFRSNSDCSLLVIRVDCNSDCNLDWSLASSVACCSKSNLDCKALSMLICNCSNCSNWRRMTCSVIAPARRGLTLEYSLYQDHSFNLMKMRALRWMVLIALT